jgi:hypothetical protein
VSTIPPEVDAAARKAAQRLHHLSMLYAGCFHELVSGRPGGVLMQGHPGLKQVRDFIDLILLTRAEINALTKLLTDAKIIDPEKLVRQFAEEYEWFAQAKAEAFGVEVTDYGLVLNPKK